MTNSVQVANKNARLTVDVIVGKAKGEIKSKIVANILNMQRRSRCFTSQRASRLLRERDDVEWVRNGVFRKKVILS
jgi:hypothetical protein